MNKSLFLVVLMAISLFSCNKKGDGAATEAVNTDAVTTEATNTIEQTEQAGETASKPRERIIINETQSVITYTKIDDSLIDELLAKNNLFKRNMTAQDFNVAGMHFYNKKQWYEAELMFAKATTVDSYHVLANYNLACVLSIQCQSGKYEYRHEVFDLLSRSLALDPGRGTKARTDPDLEWYRLKNPKYFNEITAYNYEGRTKKALYFNGILQPGAYATFVFVDDAGRIYGFKDGYHNWDCFEKFYYQKEGEWQKAAVEDLVGRRFEMDFFYVFIEAQGIEADGPDSPFGFATNELISLKELQ